MQKYKAAIVGCGSRAPNHIEAYDYIENAEVTACYAPSPTRREPLAERYGLTAYGDLDSMLETEKPDIVHIITIPTLRYDLMKVVSDHGIPLCTVEKPLATAVKDWEMLIALEKECSIKSGTKFGISHQLRWHPIILKCRDTLREFGEIKLIDMSCGMNISGQGTHILNYGRLFNNDAKVKTIYASASGWDEIDPQHTGPLTSEAYLVFDNGTRGLWTSGSVSPRCGDPATTYQHVRVGAVADCGRVDFEEFGRWTIAGNGAKTSGDYGGQEGWSNYNLRAQAGFHKAMFSWLETDEEVGTSLAASLHEWAVVLAMYQSALTRKPVDMEDFHPAQDLVEALKKTLVTI